MARALTVLGLVVAVAVLAACGTEAQRTADCSRPFDARAWRALAAADREDQAARAPAGRQLAACKTLLGLSRREVLAQLGMPAQGAEPGPTLSYPMGPRPGLDTGDDVFLDVQLEDGRVTRVDVG